MLNPTLVEILNANVISVILNFGEHRTIREHSSSQNYCRSRTS